MGVSYHHDVYFICESNESGYVDSLPERLPGVYVDVPVIHKSLDGNVVHLSSGGYNIFDLFDTSFPRPESWSGVVHRISPCQGQDFDVVDWISRDEIDTMYDDCVGEDDGYNPCQEYTDPTSDYFHDCNPHYNVLSETPNLMSDWDGDDDDEIDEEDRRYQVWMEQINTTQNQDILDGIRHFQGDRVTV